MSLDAGEFEEFFHRSYLPVCRFVFGIVGTPEDAAEVAQEAFLRLWQTGGVVEDERGRMALLFRLARNLAIDVLRRSNVRRRNAETVRTNVIQIPATPEQLLLRRQRQSLAERALERLEERQRQCLMLRASGLSYAEIGQALELNPESVGPLLTRALRKLNVIREELDLGLSRGGDDAATR